MIRIIRALSLAACLACVASAFEYRSEVFLERIRNSQEVIYADVVRHYDSLLRTRNSPVILLEKCKFMGSALYDSETEENPKYEDWDTCWKDLVAKYPDDAKVLVYRLESAYGDSAIVLGEKALERIERGEVNADDRDKATIHESLARAYSYGDSTRKCLSACASALMFSDSAKVRLIYARRLQEVGKREQARRILLEGTGYLDRWDVNQAAKLLLDMRYPRDAVELIQLRMSDTAFSADNGTLARAYEESGALDSARKYHALALETKYDALETTRRQFEFDLRHSDGKVAAASYRSYRDHGLKADPLGFHRLKLLAAHPLQRIQLRDLAGVALLALVLLGIFLVPYLWVLPLHYLGTAWFAKRRPPAESRFTFRHFWIASAGVLAADFLAAGFFQHEMLFSGLFSGGGDGAASDGDNAWYLVSMAVLTTLFALWLCLRSRTLSIFRRTTRVGESVLMVIACLIFLGVVRKANFALFPDMLESLKTEALAGSLLVILKSSLLSFGLIPTLLVVAVLVPFYEEFLFRGVFLESGARYLPFWLMNGLQAIAFALVHDSLQLFPFYCTMGLATGWLASRTGSLFVPVLVHAANNLMATFSLWFVLQRMGLLG